MAFNSFLKLVAGTIFLWAFSISALTPVEKHGNLTTNGGYLMDKNNQIVQLRGMSFYWSNPSWNGYKYYTAATVDALVDTWKCTVLRVAYDRNEGGDRGWDGCKIVIDQAIKRGVYVILDWHSHTAEKQEATAVAWFKTQAQLYKNTPNVIFEPYNEPIFANGATTGSFDDAVKTWTGIKPYLTNVTNAIRAEGAENLIILGTPYYSQYINVAASDPVVATNVAYAFHFYAASHGPNAIAVKEKGSGGMESSFFDGAYGKIPIFISEWGTTYSDGAQAIDEANTDWWFNNIVNSKYHYSTCNWSASDFEMSSAFGSGGATTTSASGTIVKRLLTTPTTDSYDLESVNGKEGPSKEIVFAMPGTHPAAQYNRYWGAHFSAAKVTFANYDLKDVRTANDSCLSVTGADNTEWVYYKIKSSEPTKNIFLRYMALGSGDMEIYLDNVKISSVSFAKTATATWVNVTAAAAVTAGDHNLKFHFVSAVAPGFSIEWFELSNADGPTVNVRSIQQKNNAVDTKISVAKNMVSVSLPLAHQYSSYSLIGIDGRVVKSGELKSSISQIKIDNISAGTMFVKLDGAKGVKFCKVVVNGN
jgi:aryl-phospho-beta-D-glucosidase BglC (GH1 family)